MIFKRYAATGLLLGLGAAISIALSSSATAYLYKKPAGQDCGKATFIGGFGGPHPSNVSAKAIPQIHTFVDRGTISCATARRVMNQFEKSFFQPGGAGKGISPAGWKCGFSSSLKAQSCTKQHVVISNGIVWVTPKK
jgi:hypothetical protein